MSPGDRQEREGSGMSDTNDGAVGRWGRLFRRRRRGWLYSDRVVRMDDRGIVIRHYYWPAGNKRIPYADIRGIAVRPLRAWHGQYRVHGVDHRRRWYSRDRTRGEKETAIDLDIGGLVYPVLTPEDPQWVAELLQQHMPSRVGGPDADGGRADF